uniref:Glycoside hydrolase 35 catalytic domain-containing protein n=1 Tax=Acrobeloides nanus TaxID=290746 RepID=A0A914D5Y9_9BILA
MNIYMVATGTNFEFYNGAEGNGVQSEAPVATVFWAGSPIAENGNINDKYKAISAFISTIENWENPPLSLPNDNPASNYGQVTLTRLGQSLISILTQIQETCNFDTNPLSFEDIDHPYGYVLYTTTITSGGSTLSAPAIRDYGYVFLNNVYQGTIAWNTNTTLVLNQAAKAGDILRILVENMGRKCTWPGQDYPTLERK